MACVYTLKGKEYSEKEFKSLLADHLVGEEHSIDTLLKKINPPKEISGGNKAVDKSGEPIQMYHGSGTSKDFEDFNDNSFFTPNDYIAENYAENQGGKVHKRYIYTKNPLEVSEDASRMSRSNSGMLRAGTDSNIINLLSKLYGKDAVDTYKQYGLTKGLGNIVQGDFEPLIKYAKENGHDSIKFKDVSFDHLMTDDTYLVFDPKNVSKDKNVIKSKNESKPKSEQPIKEEKKTSQKSDVPLEGEKNVGGEKKVDGERKKIIDEQANSKNAIDNYEDYRKELRQEFESGKGKSEYSQFGDSYASEKSAEIALKKSKENVSDWTIEKRKDGRFYVIKEKKFEKPSWMMTDSEYLKNNNSESLSKMDITNRAFAIHQAIIEGLPVPEEVLKEYPQLKPIDNVLKEMMDKADSSMSTAIMNRMSVQGMSFDEAVNDALNKNRKDISPTRKEKIIELAKTELKKYYPKIYEKEFAKPKSEQPIKEEKKTSQKSDVPLEGEKNVGGEKPKSEQEWKTIGIKGKSERTEINGYVVDVSRRFDYLKKVVGADLTIKKKNSDGSFTVKKVISDYKTFSEAKKDAINKVNEIDSKGIETLKVKKNEPNNVVLKDEYKNSPDSDFEHDFTFLGELDGKEKVDQSKPFAVGYFGDSEANRYEFATASNDIADIVKKMKDFDSTHGVVEIYNPITKEKTSFTIYPFESGYTNESVGLKKSETATKPKSEQPIKEEKNNENISAISKGLKEGKTMDEVVSSIQPIKGKIKLTVTQPFEVDSKGTMAKVGDVIEVKKKDFENYYVTKHNGKEVQSTWQRKKWVLSHAKEFEEKVAPKEEKNIPEKKVEDFTDEEMQKAYDEQAKELKKLRGADYKFQILHDEGLQMTRDDFNHYGDRNLAKGDRKFEKYFSSKALPLDKKLKSLSDQYEIEITPQDAIDYILDKNDNPLKYRESTSKTLGRNAKIPIKLADTINNLGIKTEADVEALRGFPLDDAEANLIIDYLKNNKNEKENITNESAKPSGSEDRPTTKEGEGLEGKTAKEKVTVTPPEAPKEIVEPPKKEISEGAKKSKKELAKEELEQARAEFKKAGGLSSGGFEATPQLVKLIKAYIKYGIESAKEAYKLFKEDFPDAKVKQEDFESVFDEQSLTGITRAEVKKMRDALGLGDFEKVTRHDADLYKDAEKWIEDGGDVQGLIKEYQDRKFTIDLDLGNTVLNIYKADLEAKLKTDASDANIKLAADIAHALDTAGNIFGRGLRSMQSQRPVVESLVDMYTAKQEANNVDSLTDLQKAEVQRLFDLNKKAKEEAEANYKKLEEAFSKYKAEKELGKMKKESKPKANKTHEEFVKERKDLIAKFKDAGKPKDGEAKRSGAPISDEQVKIVLQIAKSYLSEGLTNLGIIVDNISDSLGLDKDIVHNTIAGDYTQKHTRNELAEKMKDLRDEAMYANKLKALMNGEKPTTEKGRVERNQKIKDLQDKIASFKKEQADAEKQKIEDAKIKKSAEEIALEQIIKNNEKRANEIREKIAKGEFTTEKKLNLLENPEVKKQFPDLHKKAIDSITAKEDAGHEWDIAVMKDKMAQRHWLKKYVVDIGADALGTLKSVVTGIDDSAVFVQNLYALITHYKSAPHALVGHLTDFWSEKNFSRWLTEMHNSSSWDLIVKSGLNVTEPKSLIEKNKEEVFNRSLLDRPIKIKGKEYVIGKYTTQPFERMFTSLGNRLRVGIFLRGAEKLYSQGKTWENSPKEFTDLANILNTETGRGKLPEVIQKASPIITPVIWSPRLMQSTINILGISDAANALRGKKGYYGDLTPQMRKMAFADLGKFTATAIATIGLFALAGWQPDLDPRSVKFGTLTKNGKSINILGRFSSYIRLVAQVATGTEKKDNVVTDLEKGGRAKKIGRFMWGKMTPIAGTAVDLAMDENYMHEPVSVGTEVPKMFTPISIQGMIGGWRNEGAMSLINTDLPSFIGVPISFAADFKIKMPESIKVGDNQVKLTEQQQQEYQDWYDLKSEAYLNNLINLDTYKNADDKAKQEMRMVVINSAKGEAKAQIEKTYKNQFTETKEQVDERFKEATDLWELKRSVGIDAGKKPQRGDYKAHKVEGKSTLKIYTP